MSTPLNSSDQNKIQSVENALNQYIKQAQSGNPNTNQLFTIQKQLTQLLNNPNIPDTVRDNLQSALNDLKQIKSGTDLANLTAVKNQLTEALGSAESGMQGEDGGEGLGGTSLGGGGEQ